ncbi:transcription factor bHLH63 isoform X1 [Prunus yedoensis var. nudiflora]|uniref:Transcription factor bHLH63 isoform X1 n=1 Tax=Prunus yedoensis var. nudiflora TaxID=2094558 RepID=A0A314XJG7_PRUYE|nr:transcription factor bHLH63 isoform X1 [Prunus yedoensis var. nudiflora]
MKGCAEEGDSKITEQTSTKNNTNNDRESSGDTSKDNSKASEVQKPDYIHVRARRGQATDSHSLAERVRREKISERMKYLQDLVPGATRSLARLACSTKSINYVQSLQRQVEFLSMKLAAVNPRLDFNIDDLFAKEMFPACAANFQTIGMSSDMTNSAYVQFNPAQQMVSSCGLDMGINSSIWRFEEPSVLLYRSPKHFSTHPASLKPLLLQFGMLIYKTFSMWNSIKEEQHPFNRNHLQVDRTNLSSYIPIPFPMTPCLYDKESLGLGYL